MSSQRTTLVIFTKSKGAIAFFIEDESLLIQLDKDNGANLDNIKDGVDAVFTTARKV